MEKDLRIRIVVSPTIQQKKDFTDATLVYQLLGLPELQLLNGTHRIKKVHLVAALVAYKPTLPALSFRSLCEARGSNFNFSKKSKHTFLNLC